MVGWSAGRSDIISLKGAKVHFNASIGVLVSYLFFVFPHSFISPSFQFPPPTAVEDNDWIKKFKEPFMVNIKMSARIHTSSSKSSN